MFRNAMYFIKRYGLLEYMKRVFEVGAYNKLDAYLFVQHRYYEGLSESDYIKELEQWYAVYSNRDKERIHNPTSFNDKIQWLKIHNNTELRAICADKVRVRDYIRDLNVPELHLIPLLGVWDNAEEIDFSALPDAFVLKQNAACKLNYIVTDKSKLNEREVRALMTKWLEITYGYNGMELQYIKSPKRILAEQYLHELDGDLLDYKVFCFNGMPKFIEVIGERGEDLMQGHSAFFDLEWTLLNFRTATYPMFAECPLRPDNLDKIIEIARRLSTPFPFVRVDLYDISGEIFFGEMTFTPTNGLARWEPAGTDKFLGSFITIDKKN